MRIFPVFCSKCTNPPSSAGLARGSGKRGFTLVETLIAIAILMIAISGPLVIATKGLTSALYAKNQMIASFLAQETMEIVKNTRDNNVAKYPTEPDLTNNWLNGFSNCSDSFPCTVDGIDGDYYTCDPGSNNCLVWYDPNGGYSQTYNQGQSTQFSRYFYIVDIAGSNPPQKTIHVIVDWYERTIPFQIHLTSVITPARR